MPRHKTHAMSMDQSPGTLLNMNLHNLVHECSSGSSQIYVSYGRSWPIHTCSYAGHRTFVTWCLLGIASSIYIDHCWVARNIASSSKKGHFFTVRHFSQFILRGTNVAACNGCCLITKELAEAAQLGSAKQGYAIPNSRNIQPLADKTAYKLRVSDITTRDPFSWES